MALAVTASAFAPPQSLACLLCMGGLIIWAGGAAPPEVCASAGESCEAMDDPSLLQSGHRASTLAAGSAHNSIKSEDLLPPLTVPPADPIPPVTGAYGQPRIGVKDEQLSAAEYIEKFVQNVEKVVEVKLNDPGYAFAFNPKKLPGTEYYINSSYPTLFGDEGSVKQPGYGGIQTYTVLNITPSAEGLDVFRVSNDYHPLEHRCGIWWGFTSTYKSSIVDAATNVQICEVPKAVNRCTLTETFTAIVGQGWPLYEDDAKSNNRGCVDPVTGTPTTKGGFVTEFYLNRSKPFDNPPKDDVLQVVFPACQVVDNMKSSELASCVTIDLPTDVATLKEIPDLVSVAANATDPIAKPGGLDFENGLPPSLESLRDHR